MKLSTFDYTLPYSYKLKVKLEDSSEIEQKRKFSDGVYTQIGNRYNQLMTYSQAQILIENLKNNLTKIVQHNNLFLVYYKRK